MLENIETPEDIKAEDIKPEAHESTKPETSKPDTITLTQAELDALIQKRLQRVKPKEVIKEVIKEPNNSELTALQEEINNLSKTLKQQQEESLKNAFVSKLTNNNINPSIINNLLQTVPVDKLNDVDIEVYKHNTVAFVKTQTEEEIKAQNLASQTRLNNFKKLL